MRIHPPPPRRDRENRGRESCQIAMEMLQDESGKLKGVPGKSSISWHFTTDVFTYRKGDYSSCYQVKEFALEGTSCPESSLFRQVFVQCFFCTFVLPGSRTREKKEISRYLLLLSSGNVFQTYQLLLFENMPQSRLTILFMLNQ